MSERAEMDALSASNLDWAHVFELPPRDSLEKGFLFGGGKVVQARFVDWFNPFQVPPEIQTWDEWESTLRSFLLKKNYVRPGYDYCLITGTGRGFVFAPRNSRHE